MVFGQPKLRIINQKLEEIVVVPINSISRLLQSTGHYFIQISLDCVNFLNPDFLYAQVNPLFSSGSRHVPCNLLIWVLFFTFSNTFGQLELERQKKNIEIHINIRRNKPTCFTYVQFRAISDSKESLSGANKVFGNRFCRIPYE